MAIKHECQQSIYQLLKHNRDGSFETQQARRLTLFKVASDLRAGGFLLRNIHGLKQKHIRYLNQHWQQAGLTVATIKNRNAHLRWVCQKIGKANVVPSNEQLNIGKRRYAHNEATAVAIEKVDLTKITNPNILVAIHLQRYLGLRREESLKIKPHLADQGNHIVLQPSWCKGGRGRVVPILTAEARFWLNEAKKIAANAEHSLIPSNKTYIQQRNLYDKQVRCAGIQHAHGLRHAYAQERYLELTGWDCPKQGGPRAKQLTAEQKALDHKARLIISQTLGHSREAVTCVYLGR